MYRDRLYFVFGITAVISLLFFILSLNALIMKIPALLNLLYVNKIGSWQYWLLIVSLILFIYLFYLTYRDFEDITLFKKLLKSSSKKAFIENLPKLEEISKKFKGKYLEELSSAKHKWGIKK